MRRGEVEWRVKVKKISPHHRTKPLSLESTTYRFSAGEVRKEQIKLDHEALQSWCYRASSVLGWDGSMLDSSCWLPEQGALSSC